MKRWLVSTVTLGGGLIRRRSMEVRQEADLYMPSRPSVLLCEGLVASKAYTCRHIPRCALSLYSHSDASR